MDHVQGLFPLRWGCGNSIPVYGPPDEQGCDDLFKHPGILAFQPPLAPFATVELGGMCITPLPLQHSKLTHGYLIQAAGAALAYLTDTVGRRRPPPTICKTWRWICWCSIAACRPAAGAAQPQRSDLRAGDAAVAAAQTHAADAHQPSSRSVAAGQRAARRAGAGIRSPQRQPR